MHRNSAILTVVGVAVLGMAVVPLWAQKKPIPRKRPPAEAPSTSSAQQAEAAIEKGDYAKAEALLQKAVADNPKDDRAWYYLGYVYSATERRDKAIEAYKRAVDANPKFFEATLNLGIALASAGNQVDAAKYLRAATSLKPDSNPNEGLYRAWFALGRLLVSSEPVAATAALRKATELQPKAAEAHMELAQLLESQRDYSGAEKEYQQAATLDPASGNALAALTNIYMRTNRLSDAEATLRKFAALSPDNGNIHLQLARVLRAQNKGEDAAAEFAQAQRLAPNDPEVLRELAGQQLKARKFAESESSYRALVQQNPRDPDLHFGLASSLLNQMKYAEAQQEYIKTIQLKPDWGDAYGELAVAANGNKDYMMVLRALAERTKYVQDNPGTYFLRATAFDHLKDFKQASDNYKQFLAVANGKFPDQEWQARHRLIAIDPETREKNKK